MKPLTTTTLHPTTAARTGVERNQKDHLPGSAQKRVPQVLHVQEQETGVGKRRMGREGGRSENKEKEGRGKSRNRREMEREEKEGGKKG